MKSTFVIYSVLLILTASFDGGIKKYTKKNLHIVEHIDPQEATFEDLSQIGAAIGDARVVMLGEQCHGDGATFAAKSRLVKYLHEEKGFNVLAFEADFFTLNDNGLPDRTNNASVYDRSKFAINTIWSEAEECNYLFNTYIPSTYSKQDPLIITGFDNQFYGLFKKDRLKLFLKNSLQPSSFSRNVTYLLDGIFFNSLDTLTSSMYKSRQQLLNPSPQFISQIKNVANIVDTLLFYATANSSSFSLQVLKNINVTAKQILNINNSEFNSLRDSIMSENIKWLLRSKFKNDKVIIWAANSHISKKSYTTGQGTFRPMGSFIKNNLKNEDSYVLAFTSKQGQHGIFKSGKISKPLAASFENWVPDEVEYAFLDLKNRQDIDSEIFYMRAFSHGNMKMDWQSKFDGIFYVRDMYPSHRLKK